MTVTQQEAADFCRQKLMRMIGPERFELWFSADQSISLAADRLIATAESDFALDFIRKNFQSELRQLAKHELGKEARVEFVVRESNPTVEPNPTSEAIPTTKPSSSSHSEPKFSNSALLAADGFGISSPGNSGKNRAKTSPAQNDSRSGTQTADETCYNPARQDVADSVAAGMPATSGKGKKRQQAFVATAHAFQVADPSGLNSTPDHQYGQASQSATSTIDSSRKSERRWESLSSFVVDARNNIAATSAAQIVQNIGEITPLFVSGPTGSGKTHLLEGTYRAARGRVRSGRVLYMSSDQYTNQFLNALHKRSMPMFRQRFQDLDVFLLDDIQFFHNKRATVVELVQMIDNMVRHGKQLILSADRTLAELEFLGAELITRISSGLVCRVDYPAFEARKKIISQQAANRNLQLDDQVVEMVAERIVGDLRNVRGAINRLQAYHFATGDPICVENARDWLQDIFQAASKNPSMQDIEDAVCQMFGLEQATLRSDKKIRSVSQPRMLAMWLSRKYTRAALSEIGDFFGGRSHSTVVSARNKVSSWVQDGGRLQTLSGEVSVQDAIRRIETRLRVG